MVDVVRGFNRTYTPWIGVLDESYLGTGRALGPSRLLFEIGARGAAVAELRRRLGLDSGYLSRLLRRLEDEGLVRVARHPDDGRQRVVALTDAGRREWRRLDERAEELARRIVDPLDERHRAELAAALATAERLLRAATASFDIVDPDAPSAREALGRYFDELDRRFDHGFDPGGAGADGDTASLRAPHGGFVLVTSGDAVLGCGGVQRVDDRTGEVKRMWVDPDWRGVGLGTRLLRHLEAVAAELGRTRVVLDTNGALNEAIALYRRCGYDAVDRYNDNPYAEHWFARDLTARTDRPTLGAPEERI